MLLCLLRLWNEVVNVAPAVVSTDESAICVTLRSHEYQGWFKAPAGAALAFDPPDDSRNTMNLRAYDLNLLPVLDALLRRRNVTMAGKDIGLSQSATSHSLLRLRQQFGDDLLVSSGRGMVLSRRAEALAAPLRSALELLERLFSPESFDPATSDRRFKLMMADYVAAFALPLLQSQVENEAPNVSLHVTWGHGNLTEALLSHELDMVLMPQGTIDSPSIVEVPLFADELVVIAARDNPEVGAAIDLATFERLPQAVFRKDEDGFQSFADHQNARHATRRREAVTVPDFLLLPVVVSRTNCVALTHRRLAEQMLETTRIKILDPPFPTDPVIICAFWPRTVSTDPAHSWFRSILIGACISASFRVPAMGG